jgi:hypothetical protein
LEIPKIEIPKINIKEIDIPKIRIWEIQRPTLDIIYKPVVDIPACVDAHRNNLPSLIGKDEKGTYQACGTFDIPSFEPLEYNPNKFINTAPVTPQNQQPNEVAPEQPKIPETKKEKIKIEPCPSNKEQKIGDFRNEKKLLRVSGYKRGQNGIECITLYEDVPFIDQYIPSFKQFTGVFSLALVGCSAPIILNLVKPLVKNLIKKLTKKKKDVE